MKTLLHLFCAVLLIWSPLLSAEDMTTKLSLPKTFLGHSDHTALAYDPTKGFRPTRVFQLDDRWDVVLVGPRYLCPKNVSQDGNLPNFGVGVLISIPF